MATRHRHLGFKLLAGALLLALLACTPAARYNRSLQSVTLISYHRMHASFAETTQVAPGQVFPIGDGEYTARVVQFYPEFVINGEGGLSSRSDRPNNPAVKLEVHHNGERIGFSWGFVTADVPHYRRTEMLAFRLIDLEASKAPDKDASSSTKPDTLHEATP